MVDLKTIAAYITIPLTATVLILLGLVYQPESTHYCESKQIKSYCMSTSTSRCYLTESKIKNYKECNEGWKKIPVYQNPDIKLPCADVAVIAYTDIGKFYCDGIGEGANCVKWEDLLG